MDTRRFPNTHPVFDDEASTTVHDRSLLDGVEDQIATNRAPDKIIGAPVIAVFGDMVPREERVVVGAAEDDVTGVGDRPTVPSAEMAAVVLPVLPAPAVAPRQPARFASLAPVDVTPPAMARPCIGRQLRDAPPPSVLAGGNRVGALLAAAALLMTLVVAALLLVPRKGDLRVALSAERGTVERAEVLVDGQLRCEVAPCVVRGLGAGEHAVVVRAAGFQPSGVLLEHVKAGKERLLFVPMTPSPRGVLRVAAERAGVRVRVDGVDRGPAPVEVGDLAPGAHKVELDGGSDLVTIEETVEIHSGEVRDLGRVRLAARALPPSAE